ncbi:MAG: hypothetical protein JWM28_975, partial [Chitinophagaceae bacterium]|nr:hypothetical protein [Chitinophagaceae bacterium]
LTPLKIFFKPPIEDAYEMCFVEHALYMNF